MAAKGEGADSAHHFDLFWKNTLKITWKKDQNPKDEVSSSKIDEMAKDLKIVAKTKNL